MKTKAPWHLWVVGVVGLLWNGAGAYTIMMAQAGRLASLSADEAAYYAAQPAWLVLVTDIGLLGAIAGCLALLLRSRWAVMLFRISLLAIVIANAYDLLSGTHRSLSSTGAMVVTCLILLIAILLLVYASRQKANGVLT